MQYKYTYQKYSHSILLMIGTRNYIFTLTKQTRVENELLHAPVDILLPGHPRHYVREVLIQTPETRAQVLISVAVVVRVSRVVVIIVVVSVVWLI